jgi:hypothetical protein
MSAHWPLVVSIAGDTEVHQRETYQAKQIAIFDTPEHAEPQNFHHMIATDGVEEILWTG